MIETLRKSFYKNGYLLIIAAWLYILAFIFNNYWAYTSSPERVKKQLETYIKESEDEFYSFSNDNVSLAAAIKDNSAPKPALVYLNNAINKYVYQKNVDGTLSLSYWNNHEVLPQQNDLTKPDGKYFVKYSNGEYEFIKKFQRVNGRDVITAGLIPIRSTYFFANVNLPTEFRGVENVEKRYNLITSGEGVYIKNGDGKNLFGLKEKPRSNVYNFGPFTISISILAIIFLLIFVNTLSFDVVLVKGWLKGFLFLSGVLFFLRFLSYYFPFPFNFRQFELFDTLIYASNDLHRSLGDLLINSILVFWLVTFIKFTSLASITELEPLEKRKGWIVAAVCSLLLLTLAFISAGLVRSFIIDSKISFDVTNFFKLNIYTLISFIILCLIVLTFFHLSHLLILIIHKAALVPYWFKYIAIAVAGLFYLSLDFGSVSSTSNLLVLLWLLLYLFIIEYRKGDMVIPVMKSSFFLLWLIFFAGSTSALIITQNRQLEFVKRKRLAEKFASEMDPSAQSIMSIGISALNTRFLSDNFSRFTTEAGNRKIKDSLINENFAESFNRYDTRVYTFDKDQNILFNDDAISFEEISSILYNLSKRTRIPDVYYHENQYKGFSYVYYKEVNDSTGNRLGYFIVMADPKSYTREALYPELFKQVKDVGADLEINYPYAIYDKGKVIKNYGDYSFSSKLSREDYPKGELERGKNGKDNELWYNGGNNIVVVVVKKGTVLFEAITLFAYLFGSFLFIVFLFHVGQLLIKSRFRWKKVRHSFSLSLRGQIQTTIIFISIFSFTVIGVATIYFYINKFNQTNRDRLVKAIQVMGSEIQSEIKRHASFDDIVSIYDAGASSALEKIIQDISEVHSVDVNFYDTTGNLVVSTQPYIYQKQVLSKMMEPMAFYNLHFNNTIQYIQKENVGRLSYISIYMPVKDDMNNVYAYVNIPYINSEKELNLEISNFLVTLINLNALIFVLAGVIALFLTNRITKSFTIIQGKMRDINLRRANEEIEWETNDEIGALVNEYNKMVKKLEQSAQALAKSEREGAWREMARQVAHEIKNPLTPMKLSIQYLQRAIEEKKPDMQALTKRVAATLIEQIDQLAKIASDFSQFANIGNTNNEEFDLNKLLQSLVDLYSTNEKLKITWKPLNEVVVIYADRTQIHRLFTNLLQNAVEASLEKEVIEISIIQEVDDNNLQISIKDYGHGIPEDRRERIFTPNFTTKTSGTGLGLAMCKGIVEKANGKIWFETSLHDGTTFHVLLPIV